MLEKQYFDKPSGGIVGTVVAMTKVSGKDRRVAHAFLFEERRTQASLDIPKVKVGSEEIEELARVLSAFAGALKNHEAGNVI